MACDLELGRGDWVRNLPRDEYVSPLMIDLSEKLTLKMRQEMELP